MHSHPSKWTGRAGALVLDENQPQRPVVRAYEESRGGYFDLLAGVEALAGVDVLAGVLLPACLLAAL